MRLLAALRRAARGGLARRLGAALSRAVRAGLAAGASRLVVVAAAAAAEIVLPPPGGEGWQPLYFPKIERHTRYTPLFLDGAQGVLAESQCGASALVYPVPGRVDVARTPVLHWRWKVLQPLAIENERAKTGDDFAARVYVLFAFDPARASFWERMRRAVAAKLYGRDLPGRALNYVWTAHQPAGARWDNPFAEAAKMISLGRGPLPEWKEERVDLVADYESSFGTPPPAATALAVMTDADNSCQRAAAAFADFRFTGR